MARVFWFRRDLRLQDNVALNAAIDGAITDRDKQVCGVYAVDLKKFEALSGARQWSLHASLDSLGASMDRKLVIQHGQVANSIVQTALAAGAKIVHATRAFDPEGIAEQNAVGVELSKHEIFLQLDDSYYAVAPGTVRKPDGTPYRVYTPFFNNWFKAGWSAPVKLHKGVEWFEQIQCQGKPVPTKQAPFPIKAGESYALATWERFKKRALFNYDELRNRADLSGTSHLSHALAFGEIHPRTLLA
jgi:deoxyribodipyrimidine photo-lyase